MTGGRGKSLREKKLFIEVRFTSKKNNGKKGEQQENKLLE